MSLEGAPVGFAVAAASGHAAPDGRGVFFGPGDGGALGADEALFFFPVYRRGKQNVVIPGELGATEHREESSGGGGAEGLDEDALEGL